MAVSSGRRVIERIQVSQNRGGKGMDNALFPDYAKRIHEIRKQLT